MGDAHWQLLGQSAVPPAATVLEIGAGTGNLLLKIKRAVPGATVIGLDSDAAALAVAAAKAARLGIELHLDHGDAAQLPYPDETFDRILSAFVLHHLPEDQQLVMLQEVGRILKPRGSLHLLDFTFARNRPPSAPVAVEPSRRSRRSGRPTQTGQTLALLKQAGLLDCAQVGQGRSRLGRHAFYRATR